MEPWVYREQRYARINRYFYPVYGVTALLLAGINIFKGLPYFYLLAFGTLLIFPLIALVYRVTGIERVHQMEFIVVLYTFLSFPIGVVAQGYHYLWQYDKLMHTLSGVLTMLLALPVYYALRPGMRVHREDRWQAIVFCLMAAVAVAGIWEIGEYVLSLLTGMDNQRVLTTGIHDTMQDMMVCSVGALLTAPAMSAYYKRGRLGLVMGAFDGYARRNIR